VLKDVSLTINRGDSVAILGENGAGKSTFLKILAGILQPDTGRVQVEGRIGALLELGVGFDEHLSGRENALQACQLAGLSASQAQGSLEQLAEFAALGDALDEPIGHYSTGMVVRLGFAVMTITCPDVLISDEVLAVGDESFQKKCIAWVESYLANGGTLLLVSHSLYHVQRLCSRAIWLDQGAVRAAGDVFAVSQDYLAFHERKLDRSDQRGAADAVAIEQLTLTLPNTEVWTDVSLVASGQLTGDLDGGAIHWQLGRLDGAVISAGCIPGSGSFKWTIELAGTWLPGNLRLDVWPENSVGIRCGRTIRRMIRITGRAREFGTLRLPHNWCHHD